MASGKSDYLEDKILDLVLGGVAYTPPATVYIALSTAAYSSAATGVSLTEVTGDGYSRAAAPNDATTWAAASGGSKSNTASITYTPAGASGWGTVVSFYVCDLAAGGNVLYGGDLTTPRVVASGDTPVFQPGTLVFTED